MTKAQCMKKEHMEIKPQSSEKLGENCTVTMKLYKYCVLFIGILDTRITTLGERTFFKSCILMVDQVGCAFRKEYGTYSQSDLLFRDVNPSSYKCSFH